MFYKKTVKDIKIKNKRVIHRVAFDVALRKEGRSWQVIDDLRLKVIFPTLFYLLDEGCSVVLLSYLGRPQKEKPSLSLKPVSQRLSELIAREVKFAPDCVGEEAKKMAHSLKGGEILLVENTRFHQEEYEDDPIFAKKLSNLGEVFVQDAFSQCHRTHASVTGITKYLPSVAGLYLEDEIENLNKVVKNPRRPLVVVLGGAKISDKVKLLEKLVKVADYILVVGIAGNVFLKAKGYAVGKLKRDFCVTGEGKKEDTVEIARKLLQTSKKIVLPVGGVMAERRKGAKEIKTVNFIKGGKVKDDGYLLDINKETVKKFIPILKKAGTIFWNGPAGLTEIPPFDKGTDGLLSEILKTKAIKFAGGGDTLGFIQSRGVLTKFDYFSAGGGASLSFLAGEELPGLMVLPSR